MTVLIQPLIQDAYLFTIFLILKCLSKKQQPRAEDIWIIVYDDWKNHILIEVLTIKGL